MRKGALNDAMKELGCNKVAYAHHKDDLLESMMMSFLFEGRIHTFAPVTYLDRSGLTVIRPLLFLYEGDVKGFVKEYNLPVVKSPCPVDGSTKRENVKNLIGEINHQYPGAKARMIRVREEVVGSIPRKNSLQKAGSPAQSSLSFISFFIVICSS